MTNKKTWYAPDIGPIIYRKYDEEWKTTIFSQELTSFSNAGLLQADINTNQDVYNVGDTLNALVSIYNSGSCANADVYIAVTLSSGQLYFYPQFSKTIAPVLKTPVNICGSPFVSDYQLLTLPIGSGFPKGNHTWYAVLVRPSTSVMDTSNWLGFDSAPFTVK